MPLFRKKPVVIEAVQWTDTDECREMMATWFEKYDEVFETCGPEVRIKTLEGTMVAFPGDWIVRGVSDEFYPCKPYIFEKTYEPA